MNNYRRIIKTRMILLAMLIIIAVALGIYDVFWVNPELKETPVYGFQVGIIISSGLLSAITFIRYRILLKNDNKLLLMFNREKDESIKAIKAKAGIPILPILACFIIFAAIIAGYYNILIFITLIAVAAFMMITSVIIKIAYMKLM
jgi:hypothetical protein